MATLITCSLSELCLILMMLTLHMLLVLHTQEIQKKPRKCFKYMRRSKREGDGVGEAVGESRGIFFFNLKKIEKKIPEKIIHKKNTFDSIP